MVEPATSSRAFRALPALTGSRPAPPRPAMSVDRSIDGLAAFFPTESAATAGLRALQQQAGLRHARLRLLHPADGDWLRYARRARLPAASRGVPPWHRDLGFVLLMGLLAGGLVASVALLTGRLETSAVAPSLGLTVLGGAVGAAIGAAASTVVGWLPPDGHLDRVIRRYLRAGCWVVSVHDIPWAAQSALLEQLAALSVPWYVVTAHPERV